MITSRRRKRDAFLPWILLLADCLTIQAVLHACYWLRFSAESVAPETALRYYAVYKNSFIITNLTLVYFLRLNGLYLSTRLVPFAGEMAKILKAVFTSIVFLLALTFFLRDFSFSRLFLILAGVALFTIMSAERYFIDILITQIDRIRRSYRNFLIVGTGENAKRILNYCSQHPRFAIQVVGYLDDKLPIGTVVGDAQVVGRIKDLEEYVRFHREVHEVVLAMPLASTEEILKSISICEKYMVTFRMVADIFGLITARMKVSYLAHLPLLSFTDSPLGDWENRFLKRGVDIILSSIALLALAPVLLGIALLVRFTSKGRIFYRQLRIGEDGRRFFLYKFRTMKSNAEKETGPVWAQKNDSRRTPIGVFLRENNLDELPQFWNVLKGDMSLVGPRPERPHFVRQFKEDIPRYMARHSVRSGITGWAQVNGLRGDTSIEERTKFDLYYIENWSIFLDFKILFMTIFSRKNAY